jgi:predicted ferric reductase
VKALARLLMRPAAIYAVLIGNALVIAGFWISHGNLNKLGPLDGKLLAAGQLAGLFGAYLVMIQLLIMSRNPWLDRVFGRNKVTAAHRWAGFTAISLLITHGTLITLSYSISYDNSIPGEFLTLLTDFSFVILSATALAILIVIGVMSLRAARRRVSYEHWYLIHLCTYIAISLAFLHQVVVGTDLSKDPAFRIYWICLYAAVVATLLTFRFGQPTALTLRHRFRVDRVETEGPGVVSLYVTGRNLERLSVRAGQWFRLRFLTRRGWYQALPFSISAAPNGRYLRFTIKDLGKDTKRLQQTTVGTRVFLEGPYGLFTGATQTKARVLLIAGGIGITPLRALLEDLPTARGDLTLIYRATRPDDVVFRDEIDQLAGQRGATIHYIVGKRGSTEVPTDPLEPEALRELIPDLLERDVYVCGPVGMMDRVLSGLRLLHVPDSQIHHERFALLNAG